MICEICGQNTATTYYKKVINGVVTEKRLCSACAAKNGISAGAHSDWANMLAKVFGDTFIDQKLSPQKQCECCGATFKSIAETGKAGCAKCYETFYEEILPYLKRIHGNVKHIGKIPNMAPLAVSTNEDKITALRNELNKLVAVEDFENAAIVRDKIRKLEKEGNENE